MMNPNKDVFNRHAGQYSGHEYWRQDEEEIIKHFKPGNMLVGGVGAGRVLSHLYRWDITAVDIAPEMVNECKKKGYDAHVMDIQRTTFDDDSFDNIFLPFHTICYVDSAEETVKEMRRILKPGGILIFSAGNYLFIKNMLRGGFLKPRVQMTPIERTSNDFLITRQFTFFDARWMRRNFSSVQVKGRMELYTEKLNWKDEILKKFPIIDKSLYFICR